MTGYGTHRVELTDGRALRVEIRTGNHRHLRIAASLPKGWESLRSLVLQVVRSALGRGSVSVSASCEVLEHEGLAAPVLDMDRARRYVDMLREVTTTLDLRGGVSVATLATLPGVFVVAPHGGSAREGDADEEALLGCLGAALEDVVAMREAEGRRLEDVLRASIAGIVKEIDAIEAEAPARLLRERDRLRRHVAALVESVEVDEDRLAREIAYLAEKWDLAEELARLRSHVALFLEAVDGDESVERRQIGKRLGFVVQEMHREANTVGAKANDAMIAASAVAIKEELERLREQLENVE